jgi:hypothetical protein
MLIVILVVGSVIVTLEVVEQPLASVTVTVLTPALKPEAF